MLVDSPVLFAQDAKELTLNWSALSLPQINENEKQLGVPGPFAGYHNHVLLIAGGANYPEGMPWQEGKKKKYDQVYLLQKTADGLVWRKDVKDTLPFALAYGISVSTEYGVFCAGGEKSDATISDQAMLLQWDAIKEHLTVESLPSLPLPLANAAATQIGSSVYMAGGESPLGASDNFCRMDLAAEKPYWQKLSPLPVKLSHAVAVAQTNGTDTCLYIIGGRTATASGISELHATVFCFNPRTGVWKMMQPIRVDQITCTLSAATGIAVPNNRILIFGGDRGDVFHQIEAYNKAISLATTENEKEKLIADKIKLLTTHKGFSKKILAYDTLTDSWEETGTLPFDGQVTTIAVLWENQVIIPCGEIRPGVRTPELHIGSVR